MAVPSTRWSLVLRAGRGSLGALDDLCGAYWMPVYAYVRRKGADPEDAAEITQEFFAGLLRRKDLARVRRDGRPFRAWLFTALRSHLSHDRAKRSAQRRSGEHVSRAEARLEQMAAPGLDPEQTFVRQWALAVIDSALDRLRLRYAKRGNAALFDALEPCLTGENPPYAALAADLGLKEGAVKVSVHRLKKRYGLALREEVQDTVSDPSEVEQELRLLLAALSGR